MGMMKEFKEFAVKGNVIDMAVGIVIGAAFGLIVKSFVADVIMPPIGMLLGNVDFSNLFFILKDGAAGLGAYATLADAHAAGAVTLNYGQFINTIVSFLIVAFAIFIVIKNVNKMKKEEPAPAAVPTTKECPHCYSTIHIKAQKCPNCTSSLQTA